MLHDVFTCGKYACNHVDHVHALVYIGYNAVAMLHAVTVAIKGLQCLPSALLSGIAVDLNAWGSAMVSKPKIPVLYRSPMFNVMISTC